MTKKRKAIGNRDGVSIRDQWATKKANIGKRWLYRVRNTAVGRYVSSVFADHPTVDEDRRDPGCAEGDAWATRQQALLVLGQHPHDQPTVGQTSTKPTLKDLGDRYLLDRESRGTEKLSDEYLKSVRWTLSQMTQAAISDLADENLAKNLNAWFGTLTAKRPGQKTKAPVSARTKNAHLSILNTIANFGVRRKIIPYNPFLAIDKFKEGKSKRPIYSVWDLRTIVSDEHRSDPWWPHMVFAAYTGIRSESIRQVTWSMVNWDTHRFHFPKEILKTNADVHAKIQDELFTLLVDWKKTSHQNLLLPSFCTRVDSGRANILTQRYLEKVSIPRNERSVHTFRHTAASLLTATGENTNVVMDIIGHDSVNTSQHYSKGASELRDHVSAEKWEKATFYLRRVPPGLEPFPLVLIQKMVNASNQDRDWWRFMVLAVYTGFRDSVLGEITWSMVDVATGTLRIPSKLLGSDSDVVIPIQSDLFELLRTRSFVRDGRTILPPAWGDMMPSVLTRRIQSYWEDMGISTNSRTIEAFWNTVTCLHIAAGREPPPHWKNRLGTIYTQTIQELRDEMKENGWASGSLELQRTSRRRSTVSEGNLVS